MGQRQITEEDIELRIDTLQDLQNQIDSATTALLAAIVDAHDGLGMTYSQLGEALGVAKSWAFKLYKKGKKAGF